MSKFLPFNHYISHLSCLVNIIVVRDGVVKAYASRFVIAETLSANDSYVS
jgi:hypothetical protein